MRHLLSLKFLHHHSLPARHQLGIMKESNRVARSDKWTRVVHTTPTATPTTASAPQNNDNGNAQEWSLNSTGSRRRWKRTDLHVVLVNPQIPQNTGNICRTCAAASVSLHLVGPMGFEIDDRKLKRAGLDYWDWLEVQMHQNWAEFLHYYNSSNEGSKRLVGFSKLGRIHYATEGLYSTSSTDSSSTWLLFGAETTGLPPEAHAAADMIVKIPMWNYEHVRSLNLATSVGVGVFEALRQLDGAVLPEDDDEEGEREESAKARALRMHDNGSRNRNVTAITPSLPSTTTTETISV